VDFLLEFGEHRLPDDRAAHGVDLPVDQICSLAVVFTRSIKCGPQLLVERAGHFGDENRIVVIRERLMLREYSECIEWPASWANVKHGQARRADSSSEYTERRRTCPS